LVYEKVQNGEEFEDTKREEFEDNNGLMMLVNAEKRPMNGRSISR